MMTHTHIIEVRVEVTTDDPDRKAITEDTIVVSLIRTAMSMTDKWDPGRIKYISGPDDIMMSDQYREEPEEAIEKPF